MLNVITLGDNIMCKTLKERVVASILFVAFVCLIMILSSCSIEGTVKGRAYWPKENDNQIWLSRYAESQKEGPIWTWGNADQK